MLSVDLTTSDLPLVAPQQVRRVLAVTRQADAFSIHTDVAEAIGSMGGFAAVAAVAAPPTHMIPAT